MAEAPKDVDEYLAGFPAETQAVLQEIRRRIHALVPEATEAISYQIPTFKLDGKVLVHFAGWKQHVSMYPVPPTDDPELLAEIARYQVSKGTLKFPLDQPIPYDVVEHVALAHVDRVRRSPEGRRP
jgi:uncharacterized protein YdhG (YjbR/CyaY superfamily)